MRDQNLFYKVFKLRLFCHFLQCVVCQIGVKAFPKQYYNLQKLVVGVNIVIDMSEKSCNIPIPIKRGSFNI